MIRQKPGDLLEIHFDNKFYYFVVLTPIVMFGGNIIFAFHGDGRQLHQDDLHPDGFGFNVCTDLRLPKKEGKVLRLAFNVDLAPYWRTRLAKGCQEYRDGHKAHEWWIYPVDDLQNHIARTSELSSEYRQAMDSGCYSFDLVAEKIRQHYMPDQNPFLQ
jgi:hypothetical protein